MVIDRAVARRRRSASFGEDDEAGGVVRLVLDVLVEDVETVDLGGERGGERGLRSGRRARRRSRAAPAVSPATTRLQPSLRMILRHWPSAWMWLWTLLMSFSVAPLTRHQLEMDRQEMLADDVQAASRQQVVDVGDAAGERILDRDHGEVGAVPSMTAAKQSSKVAQGSGLRSG